VPSPFGSAAAVSDESIPRFDPARRRAVTAALLLVSALASFESTVVSTAMPTIIGELQGLPLYSWVFSLYLLSATVMMPLFGSLADLYGRRRVLLAALAIFLTGAGACAVAQSMPQLIAARALQGLGAAGLVPVALTVVADLYTLRERTRIQALFSSVWACAALLGPLLGAWLTIGIGWRSIFWITLPLGVLVFALVSTQIRESRSPRPARFDFPGAALLAVAVSALLFATLHGGTGEAMGTAARAGLLAVSAGAFLGFARLQGRTSAPLIPPALFARAETAAPYVAGVLLGVTIFGVDTFVPLFVQGARGGTATAAGAVVTPIIFMWAVSGAAAGRAIVSFGFRRTARFGAVLVQLGSLALLVSVLRDWSVLAISLTCAVIGAGLGPSSLSQILAVQQAVREADRGVATSLVPFMRTIGGSVGVGALGAILSAGLTRRLGPAAASAGHFLAGRHGGEAVASAAFREALAASLLPIFVLLAALAALNLFVTAYFPDEAEPGR
jgi:MFS family permease